MAFKMQGNVVLPARREVIWGLLNDAETLKKSIPGCQSLEITSATSYTAIVKVKIGPVSATFNGKVGLSNLDPPNAYRIQWDGNAGMAGLASGGADVALRDEPDGCRLIYDVDATISGKIAQLGSRMIDSVAKKLADQFFNNFAKAIDQEPAADAS